MPKYYRFRATTPNKRPKRTKPTEGKDKVNDRLNVDKNLDLKFACSSLPSWYLRRTSWREPAPLLGLPRQVAAEFRTSGKLNRPILVFFTQDGTQVLF